MVGGNDDDGEGGTVLKELGKRPDQDIPAVIMDLKVAFLAASLCAVAVNYSQAGIPKCCISTKKNISPRVLLQVQRWELQHSSGACDIDAIILRVKNVPRPICAPPKVKRVLMRIQNRRRRSHLKNTY